MLFELGWFFSQSHFTNTLATLVTFCHLISCQEWVSIFDIRCKTYLHWFSFFSHDLFTPQSVLIEFLMKVMMMEHLCPRNVRTRQKNKTRQKQIFLKMFWTVTQSQARSRGSRRHAFEARRCKFSQNVGLPFQKQGGCVFLFSRKFQGCARPCWQLCILWTEDLRRPITVETPTKAFPALAKLTSSFVK